MGFTLQQDDGGCSVWVDLGKKEPGPGSFDWLPASAPNAGSCDFPVQICQSVDVNESMSRFYLLIKTRHGAGLTETSKPCLDIAVALRSGDWRLSVGWNSCDYPWRSCQLSSIWPLQLFKGDKTTNWDLESALASELDLKMKLFFFYVVGPQTYKWCILSFLFVGLD